MNFLPDWWLLCCSARALLKTKRQEPAKRRMSRSCAPLGMSANLKACSRFMAGWYVVVTPLLCRSCGRAPIAIIGQYIEKQHTPL